MPKVTATPKLKLHQSSEPTVVRKPKKNVNGTSDQPTTSAAPSATKPKLSQTTVQQRAKQPLPAVTYEKVTASVCEGARALTAEKAKKLLGWQEESENIKFGPDNPHHLLDTRGKKVRLNNNPHNRPFVMSNAMAWCQETLMRRWRLNGETIVIGEYGGVINGQHRGAGLIFANQIWEDKQGQYQELWPTPPVMETIIVLGISEADEVVNTVDTAKPRTLADVIFRSEYFATLKQGDRRKVSKIADYAVRTLWERTGAANAYSPKRTHAESLDFIARHPRMLECVKHVYEENGTENRVGQYISPGRASALMYLMAGANTEREKEDKTGYSDLSESTDASIKPSEHQIDFKLWDKASEFWVLLAGGNEKFLPIRAAIADAKNTDGGGSPAEFTAIIIKAWLRFNANKSITAAELELEYADKDGYDVLNETPICGGVDLGKAPM